MIQEVPENSQTSGKLDNGQQLVSSWRRTTGRRIPMNLGSRAFHPMYKTLKMVQTKRTFSEHNS
jgi:hypothetical protein